MQEVVTVVLSDHQEIFCRGLHALLEAEPDLMVVGEAHTIEATMQVIAEQRPHVVLLDLSLFSDSDLSIVSYMRNMYPDTQIVVLTAHQDKDLILHMVRSGALSCISRDASANELITTVRRTAHGEAILSTGITTLMVRNYQRSIHILQSETMDLSEREREVLNFIAHGHPNADIAHRLIISERTVKTHVSSILRKLQLTDRTQVAAFAWKQGLVYQDVV